MLSVGMRLLGVAPYLNANGLNLTSLLIFTAVMGFGGSFISLAIFKWSVKKSMGVRVIQTPSNSTEFWLAETIRRYSTEAGIKMAAFGVAGGRRHQTLIHEPSAIGGAHCRAQGGAGMIFQPNHSFPDWLILPTIQSIT